MLKLSFLYKESFRRKRFDLEAVKANKLVYFEGW